MVNAIEKQIWFTTDCFPISPEEEEATNPGIYGRAFAQYLVDQLQESGESVEGLIAEDWGWCVMLTRTPCRLWIGCANEDGSATRWSAFVEAEPGILQRIF